MGAIGDSLTTAFAASGSTVDSTQFSFANGNELLSHIARLDAMDARIDAVNVAKTGATISKLVAKKVAPDGTPIPNQIDLLPRNVEYLTVTVGSSDLCGGPTTLGTFKKRAAELFRQLKERLGNAHVVVLAVPNWYQVWKSLKNDPEMQARWENGCPTLFGADVTDERRAELDIIIRSYNDLLASACSQAQSPIFRCAFAGAVFNINWTKDDLSTFDGFHPSAAGQKKLSRTAWRASAYRLRAWGLHFNRELVFKRGEKKVRLNFETAPHAHIVVRATNRRGRLLGSDSYDASASGAVVDTLRVPGWHGQSIIRLKFIITINDEKMKAKRKLRV